MNDQRIAPSLNRRLILTIRILVLTVALLNQFAAASRVGAGLEIQYPGPLIGDDGESRPFTASGLPSIEIGPVIVTLDGSQSGFAGEPPPGTVIWGAAVGQNDDPTIRHETPAGAALGVRRTFFQWRHIATGYAESVVAADVAAGRLPWISIKPPSWADVAAGGFDATLDELLLMLSRVPGDVWLTFHHEPEGGGGLNRPDDPSGAEGHLAMNRRVRERMTLLGVTNVALVPILMTWTWDPRSGRSPDAWWDGTIYDFIGVDHYVCQSDNVSCRGQTLLDSVWYEVRSWATAKNVDIAVAEWGMRGSDQSAGARVLDWYQQAIDTSWNGPSGRIIGLAAFDSSADSSVPTWELRGAQLETFQRLLGDNRSTSPNIKGSSPILWWVPVLCAPWLALASFRPANQRRPKHLGRRMGREGALVGESQERNGGRFGDGS